MKCLVLSLCSIAVCVLSAQAKTVRSVGDRPAGGITECLACNWTSNFYKCDDEVEVCAERGGVWGDVEPDQAACITRYRLIRKTGAIEMERGCRKRRQAMNYEQCEDHMDADGNLELGEPCMFWCEDSNNCNTQSVEKAKISKVDTERECYQCDWHPYRGCAESDSKPCPMSRAACATQVQVSSCGGVKMYNYLCRQKHFCRNGFLADNHENCGSSPDEAGELPPGTLCNYCSTADENNTNP